MKLTKGLMLGVVVIAGSLGLIVFQALQNESTVTFYTPQEVYAEPSKFEGKTFRVSGLVVRGSQSFDKQTHNLKFTITDLAGHDFSVDYQGLPPDLFKEGQGVVVEGRLSHPQNPTQSTAPRHLRAHLLMVKHSEVYDTQTDHAALREAKLLDSMSLGRSNQ